MFRKIYSQAAKLNNLKIKFFSAKKTRGHIFLDNGKKLKFSGNNPGLNSKKSHKLCKDKFFCGLTLERAGISSPKTYLVPPKPDGMTTKDYEQIIHDNVKIFATQHGYPLFIKPNMGSEGRGVYKVDTEEGLRDILGHSLKNKDTIIVQKAVSGSEFRVVAINGIVVFAYQKVPLQITGDGKNTIEDLIINELSRISKARKLKIKIDSPKIDFTLSALGYKRTTILDAGIVITPIPSANLAQGATPIDRTAYIQMHYSDICKKIAIALDIKFMGIDLMINEKDGTYAVIEVNSKPGFGKYAAEGEHHKARVADVYNKCITFANSGQVILPAQQQRNLYPRLVG